MIEFQIEQMQREEHSNIRVEGISIEVYPTDLDKFYSWDEAVKAVKLLGDGWRLPTRDELNQMYLKQENIGGFVAYYWSSSENSANYAWSKNFDNGYQIDNFKNYYIRVRPVRDLKPDNKRIGKVASETPEYESTTHDIKFSWEEIAYTGYSKTWRAMVFGGWIVRSVRFQISGSSDDRATATESSVFIPDPQHEWLMEPDERLNIKVKDLDLSVRARHCLRLNEIVTIGDLVSLTEYDLLKFNNFGKKSLAELKQVLGQYDLALKPRGVRVLEFHNNKEEK